MLKKSKIPNKNRSFRSNKKIFYLVLDISVRKPHKTFGVDKLIFVAAIVYTTHIRTDGQTDGRTDGQTDITPKISKTCSGSPKTYNGIKISKSKFFMKTILSHILYSIVWESKNVKIGCYAALYRMILKKFSYSNTKSFSCQYMHDSIYIHA